MCLANNLATSPPFSPRSSLSLSIRVASATLKADPATNSSVGAPLFLGRCAKRVRSVGRTIEGYQSEFRRLQDLALTLGNKTLELVQIPRSRPYRRIRYRTLCL